MHNVDFEPIIRLMCAEKTAQINSLPKDEATALINRETLKDIVVNCWEGDDGKMCYKIVKGLELMKAAANGDTKNYSLAVLPVLSSADADQAAILFGDLSRLDALQAGELKPQ